MKSGPKELAEYHAKQLEREAHVRNHSAKSKLEASPRMARSQSVREVVLVGQLPSDGGSGTCGMAPEHILPKSESDMGGNQTGEIRPLPSRRDNGDDTSAHRRVREHSQLLLPPAPDSKRKREPDMNTSFKPSEFDKQAAASLDMIDEQAAAERVQKILHPENPYPKPAQVIYSAEAKEAGWKDSAGPTLTPAPQTQPQAPARDIWDEPNNKPRKKRSDAGIPKKAPADPDEIVLRLTLTEARMVALGDPDFGISAKIQDQIIAQLQKRLDALQKQK